MNPSIYVVSPGISLPLARPRPASGSNLADLMREMVELQREQVAMLKREKEEERGRWAAYHQRYGADYGELPGRCKDLLPKLERAYLQLVNEALDTLADDDEPLSNDYELTEFLDKYSVRIAQLGNLIGPLNHLASVQPPPAPAAGE